MGCIGVAFLACDGGNVHNASVAVAEQVWHDGVAAVERAVEIYLHHALPILGVELPCFCVAACDARVIDQNVEFAEGGCGRGGSGLHRREVRKINLCCVHRSRIGESACGAFQGVGIYIPKRNTGSGCKEALGDREADAASAARDDRCAAFEVDLIHRVSRRG